MVKSPYKKGVNGELSLVQLLQKAGYPAAHRSGSRQHRKGPGPPDVDGTPFFAENKDWAALPLALWRILQKCLEDRPKADRRPLLVRLNKTGRKYPPLIVMRADEWVEWVRGLLPTTRIDTITMSTTGLCSSQSAPPPTRNLPESPSPAP